MVTTPPDNRPGLGRGGYDHVTGDTVAMRLRLPDSTGHNSPVGTRSYRLLNWHQLCFRFTHCSAECLRLLATKLRPWLELPRTYSTGFLNPDNALPDTVSL